MLNDPSTNIATNNEGTALAANNISNYGPYVRDPNVINQLASDDAQVIGEAVIGNTVEGLYDNEFNQGPRILGPTQGLQYFDDLTGITYVWNATLKLYVPLYDLANGEANDDDGEYPDPESHVTLITGAEAPTWVASTSEDASQTVGEQTDLNS